MQQLVVTTIPGGLSWRSVGRYDIPTDKIHQTACSCMRMKFETVPKFRKPTDCWLGNTGRMHSSSGADTILFNDNSMEFCFGWLGLISWKDEIHSGLHQSSQNLKKACKERSTDWQRCRMQLEASKRALQLVYPSQGYKISYTFDSYYWWTWAAT